MSQINFCFVDVVSVEFGALDFVMFVCMSGPLCVAASHRL